MNRDVIEVPGLPPRAFGAHAVRAGDFVFTSGHVAYDPRSGLLAEIAGRPGAAIPQVTGRHQAEYVLKSAERALKAANSSLSLGVRIDQFVTEPAAASPYLEARTQAIETATRPASTHVQVSDLFVPGATTAIQLIAIAADGGLGKEMLVVPDLPASPGPPFKPAPHGVVAGDFVFVTGQVAADFPRGLAPEASTNPAVWYGSKIKLQTDYTIKRCEKVLRFAGSSLDKVVRADVYLTDMNDVYEFDEVWRRYFADEPPALAFFPVPRLAPVECVVEINMIALTGTSRLDKEVVTAPGVPASTLQMSHAVRAGDFLFLSSGLATDWTGGIAPEAAVATGAPWFASPGRRQTGLVLDRLEAVCRAGGTSLDRLVFLQCLYSRADDIAGSLEVLKGRLGASPPSALIAGAPGPFFAPGCTIMLDGIAVL